jgi:peptidoglycan/LPS O-acetylase OafA/YrhL
MHTERRRLRAIQESSDNRAYSVSAFSIKNRLSGHMLPLDGIRGLAVLMVFFHHFNAAANAIGVSMPERLGIKILDSGWIGVDLFFVLSGFLITGILIDSKERPRYFINFYAKRTLRIFPLYYLFLAFVFFVLRPVFNCMYYADNAYSTLWHSQLWFWAYLQNWHFVVIGNGSKIPVTQLWSLAVEEQFYIIWPFVVFFCASRRIAFISVVLCIAAPVIRLFLIRSGWNQTSIYMSTITHADSLLLGAFVAAYARSGYAVPSARRLFLLLGFVVLMGSALIADIDGGLKRDGLALQTVGFSVISCSAALFIAGALLLPERVPLNAIICHPALRMFGKYSYSLYVFHPPVIFGMVWLLRARFGLLVQGVRLFSLGYLFLAFLSLLICLAISISTWYLIEARVLALKRYFAMDGGTPYDGARSRLPTAG